LSITPFSVFAKRCVVSSILEIPVSALVSIVIPEPDWAFRPNTCPLSSVWIAGGHAKLARVVVVLTRELRLPTLHEFGQSVLDASGKPPQFDQTVERMAIAGLSTGLLGSSRRPMT
jgi:hypothetical protein